MNKDNEIRLLPNDLSLVTLGQNIYSENCASCHGANLEGQENWKIEIMKAISLHHLSLIHI